MKERIIILLIILMPLGLSAQQISTHMTQSPEVGALAKYIDYPVSYATGVPEINIPLYTIKTKEFTLPIFLSYHASGIKVMDLSGFVGLGWSLNAEPSITRTIKGKCDEEANGYIANQHVDENSDYRYEYFVPVVQGIIDEQPDIFYYKLLDKSGKFMFYKSDLTSTIATPIPVPYEPILISMDNTKNFTIIDDNGAKYLFSRGETFFNNGEASVVSHTNSWKVDKIMAAQKNDSLLFNYYSFDNDYILPQFDDNIIVEDQFKINCEQYKDSYYQNALVAEKSGYNGEKTYDVNPSGVRERYIESSFLNWAPPFGNNLSHDHPHNCISSVYIKEIVLPDGNKVTFNADAKTKLLNSINTPDGKTINFRYGTFPEGGGGPGRARLDSVVFSDRQKVFVECYKFLYIGQYAEGIPHPGFADWRSVDYWGYYNGAAIADTVCSVPMRNVAVQTQYPTPFSFSIGIDTLLRAVNEANMKLWTLKEIYYPTGGTTTFDYETNRYISSGGQTVLTGGLRVKTIQTYDPVTQQNLVRSFSYDQPIYRPLTPDDFTYTRQKVIDISGNAIMAYSRIRTYLSSPLIAYTYNGSPIVYDKITETRGDGATTEYYYNYTTSYFPYHFSGTNLVMDEQTDWQYGDKITEINYKSGIQKTPVLRKDYAYTLFVTGIGITGTNSFDNNIFIPAIDETMDNQLVSIYSPPYSIIQGAKRITQETTTTYGDNNNPMEVTKIYKYGNMSHMYPTQIITTNGQGDSIRSVMRYPDEVDGFLASMNIRSPVLEKKDYEKGILYEDKATNYGHFGGFYLPSEEIEWNPSAKKYDDKYIYDSYDSNGNILQGHKANDYMSAVIWDYSTHLPVIIANNVTNATLQSVVQSSLPSGYNTLLQLLTAVDGIATDSGAQSLWTTFCRNVISNSSLSGSTVTLYTYKPYIGMTSSTDSKGTATYYEYDSFNRLKNVMNAEGKLLKSDCYHYAGKN